MKYNLGVKPFKVGMKISTPVGIETVTKVDNDGYRFSSKSYGNVPLGDSNNRELFKPVKNIYAIFSKR